MARFFFYSLAVPLYLSMILLGMSCRSAEPGSSEPDPVTPDPPVETGCVRTAPDLDGTMIDVSSLGELLSAVDRANQEGRITIRIENGTYPLSDALVIRGQNVTLCSRSGQRAQVRIYGQGMNGGVSHIFNVSGSGFRAMNMTLGRVANHAIQIHSSCDEPLLHNLHIIDCGEQLVKVSYIPGSSESSERGLMEWCLLEYSAGVGPQYYIGGIDAHQAHEWIVRHNRFVGIRSPEAELAEHAVHFWSGSRGTLVEHNTIIDCDRGIGFGLGDRPHFGGIIRNNMVYVTRDVGIGLESCDGAMVWHNSVFCENYDNAIEYRFSASRNIQIINNLCNARIHLRDGAAAELSANISDALSTWFVDLSRGDLHLSGRSWPAVDGGQSLPAVAQDIDCEARPKGSAPDIGADEV